MNWNKLNCGDKIVCISNTVGAFNAEFIFNLTIGKSYKIICPPIINPHGHNCVTIINDINREWTYNINHFHFCISNEQLCKDIGIE